MSFNPSTVNPAETQSCWLCIKNSWNPPMSAAKLLHPCVGRVLHYVNKVATGFQHSSRSKYVHTVKSRPERLQSSRLQRWLRLRLQLSFSFWIWEGFSESLLRVHSCYTLRRPSMQVEKYSSISAVTSSSQFCDKGPSGQHKSLQHVLTLSCLPVLQAPVISAEVEEDCVALWKEFHHATPIKQQNQSNEYQCHQLNVCCLIMCVCVCSCVLLAATFALTGLRLSCCCSLFLSITERHKQLLSFRSCSPSLFEPAI